MGGTPLSPDKRVSSHPIRKDGGTPPIKKDGVHPLLGRMGAYPPSGMIGYAPQWGRMGYPHSSGPDGGTLPPKVGQTHTCENITSRHPSDAGSKNLNLERLWLIFDFRFVQSVIKTTAKAPRHLRRMSQFSAAATASPPTDVQVKPQQINKYMRYLSTDTRTNESKPMVVIYGWLMSKEKHYRR